MGAHVGGVLAGGGQVASGCRRLGWGLRGAASQAERCHGAGGDRRSGQELAAGQPADLTVFDLDAAYTVDPEKFLSMGRATPFAGMDLYGVCRMTMIDGNIVWQEGEA